MKNHFAALFMLLAFAASIGCANAQAVPVFDYGNWLQNLQNNQATKIQTQINQAKNIAEQVEQIYQQYQQIVLMKQSLGSGSWAWGQINAQITALNKVLAAETTFKSSDEQLTSDIDQAFQYHPPVDFQTLYNKWNTNTEGAVLAAAKAAKLTVSDNQNELQIQATNRAAVANAGGVKDAVQGIGKIADQQVEQLEKLSQLEAVHVNLEKAYYTQTIAKQSNDVANEQALRQWAASGSSPSNVPVLQF